MSAFFNLIRNMSEKDILLVCLGPKNSVVISSVRGVFGVPEPVEFRKLSPGRPQKKWALDQLLYNSSVSRINLN